MVIQSPTLRRPAAAVVRLAVAAALTFAAALASAGESALTIRTIEVTGLRRTKEKTVTQLLERYIGSPAAELDKDEVSALLIRTGIFENVRAAAVPSEDGTSARLEVAVDEKWSIIPAPVFAVTSSGITAGAAFLDANAFGLNDKLLSVALKLPSGWMTSIAYTDESDGSRSGRNSVSAYISMKERTDEDTTEATLRRYQSSAVDFAFETARPLFLDTNASLGFAFKERGVSDPEKSAVAEPDPARVFMVRTGLSTRSSDWNGVFLLESLASLGASYSFGLVGDSFYTFDARAVVERPLGTRLRARASAAGLFSPLAPAVFDVSPSALGLTILPSDFAARSAASAVFGLEARLAAFRFGLLSALVSYEGAVVNGELLGTEIAHGPSAGIRLYVAKVAVPAMSVVVSYNAEADVVRGSFGIGMRM